MIQTVGDLRGDPILARDGAIGSVDDVYFDDQRWAVRYLVVDTGSWLPGKRVLISPASVDVPASSADAIRVRLNRDQVQNAPGEECDLPVSRQYEKAHAAYFGYPPYWTGPLLWGRSAFPLRASGQPPTHAAQAEAMREAREAIREGDAHLRSCTQTLGYGIEACDGPIGEVQDFLIDERDWSIRDVVIDTRVWWPGGHVHVSPEEVERIDWGAQRMYLRLTRDEVRARASGR